MNTHWKLPDLLSLQQISSYLCENDSANNFWLCIPNKQLLHFYKSQQNVWSGAQSINTLWSQTCKIPSLFTTFYLSYSILSTKLVLHPHKDNKPTCFPHFQYYLASFISLPSFNLITLRDSEISLYSWPFPPWGLLALGHPSVPFLWLLDGRALLEGIRK